MNYSPIHSTREFIDILKNENELLIVDEEIDPIEEIAEFQRRIVARKGPAILFTKVKGSKFSVATNLYGSMRRIEIAFGKKPLSFFKEVAHAMETLLPPTFSKLWSFKDLGFQALKVGTKKERRPKVLESQINPLNLEELPALKSWPKDGGRFITLPLVYTESPISKKGNLGMYRIQLHSRNTTGMHFQIHRGIGFHYFEAEKLNQSLPAHIYVGGPPAMTIAAIAPLPEEISELLIASLLLGERLKISKNKSISHLPIVSDSDFLIVGDIPPFIRHPEGPFGDHYGYYALQHDYPIFKAHRVYHRKDAIWPATVVGRPPQEDHYIAEYLQELLSPMFPIVMPKVVSVWAYEESGVHSLAAAVVKERYHREAFTAAFRILGEGHLSLSKCLLVTDQNVNLKDFRKTFVTTLERMNLEKDLHIFNHISQDTLDYTGPEVNKGSKLLLIGTGDIKNKLCNEFNGRIKSNLFNNPRIFCPGVLVISGPKYSEIKNASDILLKDKSIKDFMFVFIVDNSIDATKSSEDFIWHIFTRFEPASDIYGKIEVNKNHISFSAPVIIDCRIKPWYPENVEPSLEIINEIDEKFRKYF